MTGIVERVLLVVFDGLRPDMIAGRMPALDAFRAEAVTFTGARSVFPSLTRVATTAIGSGHWPRTHGIVGNAFHQPQVVAGQALDTSNFGHLALARTAWGRVVTPATLGERLAAAGLRMAAVHGGSAGSAFLINPEVATNGHWTVSLHGEAATQTPDAFHRARTTHGEPPRDSAPKCETVAYTAEVALTQALGPDGPEVVVVWFPEPDTSFHYREIGSPDAAAAMAAADAAFARLLDRVRGDGRRTAVLALSDHGQISTTGLFPIEAEMRAAGISAAARPGAGDRIALTLGASGEVRPLTDERTLAVEAAAWLMARDEIGMVFARDDLIDAIPGALPLSAVALDHPRAAPLVYVMRSDDGADRFGLAGRGLMTGGGVPVGGGMHGGLNRHELATVLMLGVPGAAAGKSDDRPCALPDIAPTVLALLGLDASGMDGEALPWDGSTAEDASVEELHACCGGFAQSLTRRRSRERVYIEFGGRA